MKHEEKIKYMGSACSLVGLNLEHKHMDLIVSLYDKIQEKKGETNLEDILTIRREVEERQIKW